MLNTTSLKEIEKGMRDGGYMRAHLSSQKVESSWFGEIRQKSGCIIWNVNLKCLLHSPFHTVGFVLEPNRMVEIELRQR